MSTPALPQLIDTEILEHARIGATFFQGLLVHGVGVTDAAGMAMTYLNNLIMLERFRPTVPDKKP